MKKVLSIIAMGAFVVAMSSCSKCTTCTYTTDEGATGTAESCGSTSDNEDFEADINAQWAINGTVTCVED